MGKEEVTELKHIQNFQFKYGEEIVSLLKDIKRTMEEIKICLAKKE